MALLSLSSLLWLSIFSVGALTYTIDLSKERHGITQKGIAEAINKARAHFRGSPDDTVTIYFKEGHHVIHLTGSGIDLRRGIKPGSRGRLVFTGAGMDKTTLEFSGLDHTPIYGRNVYRTTFSHLHLTRGKQGVTQGRVHSVSRGAVVLEITQGFPSPADVFNKYWNQGRYLRRYVNSADPQIVTQSNGQIPWTSTSRLSGNLWTIHLKNGNFKPSYKVGDLIGVKSKCCVSGGGSAYWFCRGDDIVFDHVKWTRQSRGVLRCGINNIRFSNCAVKREPPVNGHQWCLATSGGGPQIGQPNDPKVRNVVAENHYSENTGDDGIAFFNVENSTISNCFIRDSFARGILLYKSKGITLVGNTLVRSNVLRQN